MLEVKGTDLVHHQHFGLEVVVEVRELRVQMAYLQQLAVLVVMEPCQPLQELFLEPQTFLQIPH